MRIRIADNTHAYRSEQYTRAIRFSIGESMNIGERIEAEMQKREWSEGELARRAGINQPTVHRIIKGESKSPRRDNVEAIAKAFGCSAEWLWTGAGVAPLGSRSDAAPASSAAKVLEMLEKHGKGLGAAAREKILQAAAEDVQAAVGSNVIVADFSRPGLVGDEISIAHYDIRGAMGNGQVPADYMEMLKDVKVSESHLRKIGVTFDDPNHLKMVYGWGYSMTPTIKHADPMIVDISIRDFNGDGIFIFTWQGHLYIKRLQVQDAEHFEMISDNKQHKDRVIRMDETYIHARVLLVWNAQLV